MQQGDFLLIILKNLIEKQQSTWGKSKLKIILMYVINLFFGESLFAFLLVFVIYKHLVLLNGALLLSCRSATVDSHLFSQYFDNCPVVTAQGRMHPVSTQFLEDIYENLNYSLASDSPAFINNAISGRWKV